ncbi:MAG TPA: extracellular solute-binding protein [Candidatus Limnocylindria bacterium]|nr:extracellular solute-binding protein [Candidatus Limnocylindria bacterium]
MGIDRSYDRRTFLKLAGATAAIAACGGATTTASPTPAATTAATAAPTATPVTGTISVYSALNESTNNQFFDAFKKAYPGVTVNVLPLAAAGELQTRIRTEKASPKADIFIGGSSEFHDPLGKEGLLEAYIAPNAKDIDAKFKEPTGLWTGWYTGIFGFISNNTRLGEVGNKKPSTWDDLLDAAWKGKLILPSPVTTGGGYIFIATQIFRFNRDEAKAMDYMKKLHANVATYPPTSPGALTLIDQGQYIGCPNWAHDILTEKGKGNPIDLTIPSDTGFEVGAVSIVKGTKSLAAAQALVNWSITKEAGELNVKLSNRGSTRTDVAPAPGAPKLSDVKLVSYDRQWATDNKDRIIKLWQQTVGI